MARVFLKPQNEENLKGEKVAFLLYIYFFCPLLSFPLVYAFANVLMRCVVTMVSNVSDSSESWPCMSLHAHMLEHLQMPHSAGYTQACTYTAYNHKHLERYALLKVCVCVYVHVHICAHALKENACKSAKRCVSGRNSCSFLHEKRNFLLLCSKPRSVSQDINQSAMSRLNEGSKPDCL